MNFSTLLFAFLTEGLNAQSKTYSQWGFHWLWALDQAFSNISCLGWGQCDFYYWSKWEQDYLFKLESLIMQSHSRYYSRTPHIPELVLPIAKISRFKVVPLWIYQAATAALIQLQFKPSLSLLSPQTARTDLEGDSFFKGDPFPCLAALTQPTPHPRTVVRNDSSGAKRHSSLRL